MAQRCVFVWENLGPTHEDRLAALERRFPGAVAAVQFVATSNTYLWTQPGVHAAPTRTLADARAPAHGAALAWRLVRACRRTGARDVYLCHYDHPPILMAAIALRLLRRRVFCMVDSKFDDRERSLPRELLKALFLAPYSGALVAGERARAYLRFLGFRRRPIALGYDALSVERVRAQCTGAPAPEGAPHAARDFLVVARLVPKKNVGLAITAFAQWRGDTTGARKLRILGSGPLEPELRAQAGALGIADAVVFEGFVQTERVSAALANALCLILPSVEEQFGLVVIEAMALGVPALVSGNAGAVDVMIDNGVNGWIVDPRSPRALAAAMRRLDADPAEWSAMARAAAEDSRRGDAAAFVRGVAELSGLA